MRKQIAAANWKMNNTLEEGTKLLNEIINSDVQVTDNQCVIFAVPFPYLVSSVQQLDNRANMFVAAQNCHNKTAGAYTGEVSVDMLASINIQYCVVGHSERREYFSESNQQLAEKVDRCLSKGITPIFCCGEPLSIRENDGQNDYVAVQLNESLFHLDGETLQKVVIAYEPIWAIGTGKTATAVQAQEMHAHIRAVLSNQFGEAVADNVSILYGGSVKGANANEIFSQPDVDGGLVGGASLIATEFIQIIKALK
jgi:triosephosphate isomerase (TIM)